MILDTLEHIETYQALSPRLYKGLQLLRDYDFSTLEDGKHTVDGDDLFFLLQSYHVDATNEKPEAHRTYIDIQFILSGAECIGVAPRSEMEGEIEAKPENDIWFYHGKTQPVLVTGRRFLVLFPQDAHAPACVSPLGEQDIRKCVVKVRV